MQNVEWEIKDDKLIIEIDVDGRDKVSQKWSFKNEPPG